MQLKKPLSVLAMLVLIGTVAGADEKKPAAPISWATTLPVIELANQPLEKVLNEMKAKLPGFDFSISRENVPHDYPVLPAMTVENVSLYQFAQLIISELPGVRINENSFHFADPVVWKIDISPDPNASTPPAPFVRIFGLADVIASQQSRITSPGDHQKQACDDILSLIQAALDLDGESPKPIMKIHPPTQTLLFKGSVKQAAIVESALAAMTSTIDQRMSKNPSTQPATTQSTK